MSRSPLDDPDLPALVSSAVERLDLGLEVDVDDLCADRPDLAEAVRDCLGTARRMPSSRPGASPGQGLIGHTLGGRYRLQAGLGAGAMGVVYRARDLSLPRDVAIKILRGSIFAGSESESRFEREAEALAAIRHAAVLTIHDRGETRDGEVYLVLELLEGRSLDELLEEAGEHDAGRSEHGTEWFAQAIGAEWLQETSYVRLVARLAAELASGLHAAHRAGVFHRDVKPSNIFVRADGSAVLLDFGIAAQADKATITREGSTIGTPAYMAPESLLGHATPSPALDVYGLAATLYHLLTLRPPYSGSPTAVLARLVKDDPMPLQRLRPNLPRDLRAIVEQGMSRSPSRRYRDAAEFEEDLRAFLEYRPVKARPVPTVVRAMRRMRRSPATIGGLLVLLLGLVSLTGHSSWREWRQRRADRSLSHLAQVSPNLALLDVPNRRTQSPEEYAFLKAQLDAAAESRIEPLPSLLQRACFHFDHDEFDRAARDVRAIAEKLGTEYADALAARYEARVGYEGDASDWSLEGLPEPSSPLDVYLAGFHELREAHFDAGAERLRDPRLDEFWPARELRLLLDTLPILKLEGHAREEAAFALYERVLALEEDLGQRTSMSAHLAAFALVNQRRYRECIERSEEGLALAPYSHILPINAGKAAMRLLDHETAERLLRHSVELRPNYYKPYEQLIRVLTSAARYDEARTLLAGAPLGDGARDRRVRHELTGEIGTLEALDAWRAGREDEAAALAEGSLEQFETAATLGKLRPLAHREMSRAIAARDPSSVVPGLLRVMACEPDATQLLPILLDYVPDDLDGEMTLELTRYLESLAHALRVDERPDSP